VDRVVPPTDILVIRTGALTTRAAVHPVHTASSRRDNVIQSLSL
jgi:hypothetical protein